jgi:hypothetical protein
LIKRNKLLSRDRKQDNSFSVFYLLKKCTGGDRLFYEVCVNFSRSGNEVKVTAIASAKLKLKTGIFARSRQRNLTRYRTIANQ